MTYPNYLIHFNRNHDKLGRFAAGDGDGDGRRESEGGSSGRKKTVTRLPNTGYHREGIRGAEKVSSSYLTKPVSTSRSLSGNKRASTSAPNGIFKAAGRNPQPNKNGDWGDNNRGTPTGGGGGGGNVTEAVKRGQNFVENALLAEDLEEMIKKNKIGRAISGDALNNKDTRGYRKVDNSKKHDVEYTHTKGAGNTYGDNRHVKGK